jgi:hypothetical protein
MNQPPHKPKRKWTNVPIPQPTDQGVTVIGIDLPFNSSYSKEILLGVDARGIEQYACNDVLDTVMHFFGASNREEAKEFLRVKMGFSKFALDLETRTLLNHEPVKYGWYSEKAIAAGCGSAFYATIDGQEVEVTGITTSPRSTDYYWDDKVFVGKVTKYLRRGEPCDHVLADHAPTPTEEDYDAAD